MNRKKDYILDIKGVSDPKDANQTAKEEVNLDSSFVGRPWISVFWECCHVYSRVYRNAQGSAYHGNCPKCGKKVTARVGKGGTNSRSFTAK